jgi:NAD(P)-dependent dehydrogenase (short-subunit alcohol dehydrogenase family)
MIPKNKNAVLYGVSESLSGAVAQALAEAGAKVFLTARRLENARKVADQIRAAGGQAEADEVDALDERAVNHHADQMMKMSGTLDISFNLINLGARQGHAVGGHVSGRFCAAGADRHAHAVPHGHDRWPDHVSTALGRGALADCHARGHRLSDSRRIWAGLLRDRSIFQESRSGAWVAWCPGRQHPVGRFTGFPALP